MFTTFQTAITRNSFPREYHSLSFEEQIWRDFLHHGYLSCDGRERKTVGKFFHAITLRVYKKITNKNTGKPQHTLRD